MLVQTYILKELESAINLVKPYIPRMHMFQDASNLRTVLGQHLGSGWWPQGELPELKPGWVTVLSFGEISHITGSPRNLVVIEDREFRVQLILVEDSDGALQVMSL